MTSILLNPLVKNRPVSDLIFGEGLQFGETTEIVTDGHNLLFLGVQFPCLRFLQRNNPAVFEFHFPQLKGSWVSMISFNVYVSVSLAHFCTPILHYTIECRLLAIKKHSPNRTNRFVISSAYLLGEHITE